MQTTNDNKYISLLGKHANNIIFYIFSFFFFDKKKGVRGRPYVTYPPGRDIIGAPPR